MTKSSYSQRILFSWLQRGTKFLPFSDAASADLPLSRLLRLSLFQVSVGMALALLIGTLNRVMIVELHVPASWVSVMVAMPIIVAPFRALIGFSSDTHHSELGWKRVPFIWRGTLVQFGGLAMMPFALLVLSGQGHAAQAPLWIGHLGAGVAFLLVGAGLHTTQTAGLALATDLAPEESRPKVVGLMYVMLLVGMMVSAMGFGAFLSDFSPGRLIQVLQASALLSLVLNVIALWKQESRVRVPLHQRQKSETFQESWTRFCHGGQAIRRLVAVGLGTMAFSMEDILLEPYGGEILHLSVGTTTALTATLALGGLLGFSLASNILSKGFDPFRMASIGALCGIPAFLAVILSAAVDSSALFALGILFIGFGGGLFGHGTLTATMNLAPPGQSGLALGAWGAVQATAAGLAIAAGGVIRDLIDTFYQAPLGYDFVYSIEIVMLAITVITMLPLMKKPPHVVRASH
jgi:BCD family chlorophyll transporter-like MFS transporter